MRYPCFSLKQCHIITCVHWALCISEVIVFLRWTTRNRIGQRVCVLLISILPNCSPETLQHIYTGTSSVWEYIQSPLLAGENKLFDLCQSDRFLNILVLIHISWGRKFLHMHIEWFRFPCICVYALCPFSVRLSVLLLCICEKPYQGNESFFCTVC